MCYFNLCADGETLLVKDLKLFVKALLDEGHFVEIVTNMSLSDQLKELLDYVGESQLERISFKCSLHYLELKKKDLLNVFANNVNFSWDKGCSASIELVGSDTYIPYLEEIKKYCLDNIGALPHIAVARDDRNKRNYC